MEEEEEEEPPPRRLLFTLKNLDPTFTYCSSSSISGTGATVSCSMLLAWSMYLLNEHASNKQLWHGGV